MWFNRLKLGEIKFGSSEKWFPIHRDSWRRIGVELLWNCLKISEAGLCIEEEVDHAGLDRWRVVKLDDARS